MRTKWEEVPFLDAFETSPKNTQTLPRSAYQNQGKFPVVDQSDGLIGGWTDDPALVKTFDRPVVVFGDHTRCLKFVDFPFAPGADGTKVLIPAPFLDPRFAFYQLLAFQVEGKGYARHFGELKKRHMKVPPLAEQQRIVAKLDAVSEHASRLDHATMSSVSMWQDLYAAECRNAFEPRTGWKTVILPEISENLDGIRRPVTRSDRQAGPHPYYGASGVVDYVAGYLFDEELLLVSEDGANLLARSTPIAFTATGKYWVNNHAHVLRFKSRTLHAFVEAYLNSIPIDEWVTGATQPKLNQGALNRIPIPLPGSEAEIERVLKTIRDTRAISKDGCDNSLRRRTLARDLKQSVLEAAFRGEL